MLLTFGIASGSVLLGQTTTTGSDQFIGWFIVALLVTMFVVFIISLLRAKPTEATPTSDEDSQRLPQKLEVEIAVAPSLSQTPEEQTEEVTEATSAESKNNTFAAKNKGLKGKKKQQKKKINSTRQQQTVKVEAVESPVSSPVPTLTRASSGTNDDLSASGSGEIRTVVAESESTVAVERTAAVVETVAIVSTHTINAMANKPRLDAKPKAKPAKPVDAKNNAVQGFHKFDRHREPVRVFAAEVPSSFTQSNVSAATTAENVGGIAAEESASVRQRQRGTPHRAKTVQEGPRTLKDFLSKKSNTET